jgi:lauroyl/myristoyl acyltransferase
MPLPAVTATDFYQVLKLLVLAPPSWLLPIDRLWPVACSLRDWTARRDAVPNSGERLIARVLCVTQQQASEIQRTLRNRMLETLLQILALHRPGRRWHPAIRLHGLANLQAALERRSGAILWVSDFIYGTLITKMAFHRAGLPLIQLSRPTHGFSITPFGMRFLNPQWMKIEDRFLVERVLIAGEEASAALGVLRNRLAANGVVSILVTDTARRTYDAKFFDGTLRVATGPLHLSRSSGAPLFPVFTVRSEDGVYDVWVGRSLDVDDASEPNYGAAIRGYVTMLEPHVLKHPDQWNGWVSLGRLAEESL